MEYSQPPPEVRVAVPFMPLVPNATESVALAKSKPPCWTVAVMPVLPRVVVPAAANAGPATPATMAAVTVPTTADFTACRAEGLGRAVVREGCFRRLTGFSPGGSESLTLCQAFPGGFGPGIPNLED